MKTLVLLIAATSIYAQSYTPIAGSSQANTLDSQINSRFTDAWTAIGTKQPTLSVSGPLRLISNTVDCPTCVTIPYVLTGANILAAIGAAGIANAYLQSPYFTVGGVTCYLGTNCVISSGGGSGSGTVTGVTASAPMTSSGSSTTPNLAMPAAASGVAGYLTAADWATFTAKQAALGFTPFANPMTTAGDIIFGGASGVATRLAKSADGYVLTLVSGAPAWVAASGGGGSSTFAGLSDAATANIAATNTSVATPLATAAAHFANTSNPHSVTKAQVGLGNVANFDTTNASNISSGTLGVGRLPAGVIVASGTPTQYYRGDGTLATTCAPGASTTAIQKGDGSGCVTNAVPGTDYQVPITALPPNGSASGDLAGSYPSPTVGGIKGVPFCTGYTPTTGQLLQYTTASSPNPCYTAVAAPSTTNCVTSTVPSSSLTTAGTTQDVTLSGTLPAKSVVTAVRIKEQTQFTCTGGCSGISAVTVSVGYSGAVVAYAPAWPLLQAVAATNRYVTGGAATGTDASNNVVAHFAVTNATPGNFGTGSATNLTAGSVEVSYCYVQIP